MTEDRANYIMPDAKAGDGWDGILYIHQPGKWVVAVSAQDVVDLRADRDRLAAENARLRAAMERTVPAPPSGNVEEVVTQRPLLTYLAQQKASLEWIAERAALMDDNKNLQTYRAEINDLSRYIESVKALLRPIVALGGQAAAEQEE